MIERAKVIVNSPKAKRESQFSQKQNTFSSKSDKSSVDQILFLQKTIGNLAVQRMFKTGELQTKLKIGEPNDIYEQEADRVADIVMRMSDPEAISNQISATSIKNNSLQMKPG